MSTKSINLSKATKDYIKDMNKMLEKIKEEDKTGHKDRSKLKKILSRYDAEVAKLRKVKEFDSTQLEVISAVLHAAIESISYDTGVIHGLLLGSTKGRNSANVSKVSMTD